MKNELAILLNDIKFYDNNFKNLKVSDEIMDLLKIDNVNFCITPPHNNTKPHLKKIISKTDVLISYLTAKNPDIRFGGIYRNCCHINSSNTEISVYDTCIHFNFPEILKNIRSGKNLYQRFQKYPHIAIHISNLKWRAKLYKKGLYNPKDINNNLLDMAGYKN